ncbi:MAG TPA: glycosyltransferase [Jatrophihabitantaceae bacterium]|nr:glycosyltransferase [Jatrophihabitantaceae bacterium]
MATFAESLRTALVRPGSDEGPVIRLVEQREPRPVDHVVAQWMAGDDASMGSALGHLNRCSVAILQHEYGVFGGPDGDEVLDLMDGLTIPCIVVLHTVLTAPTTHQREVLEAVVDKAAAVVVMTATARDRLVAGYAVDIAKLSIIAHGAPPIAPSIRTASPVFRTGQPTILTWGLLGPGKGIEWGIEAMAMLRDLSPMPRYVVAGQTHPKVLLREGEAYRNALRDRVRTLGLADAVTFEGHYRDSAALSRLVSSADVVLLPYDSTDQVTSGVLIEAVAAGKPVVATGFPHATELLSDGAGLIVAHGDPTAIAAALRSVLTSGALAANMAGIAAASAPRLLWPAIAEQYRTLAARLVRERVAA